MSAGSDGRHVTGTIPNNGVPLAFRRFGQTGKTPLLIVHGLSYFSYDWIGVAAPLALDREVVAIDMRGFGDSGHAPDRDYSILSNARDFMAVCDFFAWPRVVLLGHSMGGRHCLYCASQNPTRVAALIAVDFAPAVDPQGQARVAASVGRQPDAFASVDACIEYLTGAPASAASLPTRKRVEQYTRETAEGVAIKRDPYFRDQFKRILDTGQRPSPGVDLWHSLTALTCPTLFVRGRRSDMFSAATVDKVRVANARAEVVELDTGHDVGGEDPGGLVRVVGQFLDRCKL